VWNSNSFHLILLEQNISFCLLFLILKGQSTQVASIGVKYKTMGSKSSIYKYETILIDVYWHSFLRISIRARCKTLCYKVCQWLATGRWFSPGSPVSLTNKTDTLVIGTDCIGCKSNYHAITTMTVPGMPLSCIAFGIKSYHNTKWNRIFVFAFLDATIKLKYCWKWR
jgi:hypothetical protein